MKRLFLLAVLVLAGCADSPGPDPKVEATRLSNAQTLRGLFDHAGGDYGRLDAAGKAEFVRLNGGDEAKAQAAWNVMKYGSAGVPKGTGTGAPR